jgi:HemK-like putative methylase
MAFQKVISQQDLRWIIQDKYHGDFAAPGLAEDKKRLEAGEPLAYVIGWTPFLNCQIDLSLKPLIPRPETEFWVGEVIYGLKDEKLGGFAVTAQLQVLDLCCGSGCIGIALLKNLPNVTVDFADISETAIKQTKINLQKNSLPNDNLTKRSRTFVTDLFNNLPVGQQYDLIVCNPPYVDRFGDFAPEIAHEPAQALFAQSHGLALIEQVINQSKRYLKLGGKLILEFGEGQENEVAMMSRKAAWADCRAHGDQYDVIRWAELIA